MNGTNKGLLAAMVGVVSVYVALSLLKSVAETLGGDGGFEFYLFDIANCVVAQVDSSGSFFGSLFIDVQDLLGGTWDSFEDMIETVYVDPLPSVEDALGADVYRVLLMTAGAALVIGGMACPSWTKVSGSDDDPRQWLITHRPYAVLWAAELPWNVFLACWTRRKVPVVIPIVFVLPIAMFAIPMTVVSLVLWAILRLATGAAIASAGRKDRTAYKANTGYAVCPECLGSFEYPRAACQSCDKVFDYPVPDGHGYKEQYCNDGHRIPCRNDKGLRSTLTAVCPRCGARFKTREARPHAIAMVGATGSGKTSLILSAVSEMYSASSDRGIVIEASEGLSRDRVERVAAVSPTAPGARPSLCVFLRRRDLPDREVLFNDVSGAEFEPEESRDIFEEYYRYADGFVFAIDPSAVQAVHVSKSLTRGSKTTPKSTFDTFFQIYSTVTGNGPSSSSDVPMAVVLTRSKGGRDKSPEEFLAENGQEEFVDTVRQLFSDVRFFYADPVDDPASAAEPLKWILGERDPELRSALWPSD